MNCSAVGLNDPKRSTHPGGTQLGKMLRIYESAMPSDPIFLDDVVAGATKAIARSGYCNDVEDIGLAVREALANAIVHGNNSDPAKSVRICVALNENGDLFIVVQDSGQGFEPTKLPDPIAAENLLANHGRGIFLMKQLMDEVDFRFDHGTEVRMVKRRQSRQ